MVCQALAEGHMLTSEEEAALRETLHYREEDRWLHLFYRSISSRSNCILAEQGRSATQNSHKTS